MNIERHRSLGIPEALAEIMFIEQQAQVMGAQDYESSAFNIIKQQLREGKITPEQAILQARQILDIKQDYH